MVRMEEEFRLSLMRGGCCHPPPPRLQGAEPARGSRSEPNNLFVGRSFGFIVYPPRLPRFDSREMPKARPGASTSLCFESRHAGRNRGLDFCNFHLIAMPATSSPRGDVLFLCSRKRKKLQREIKNYWFFSTGPQQLMMINDGDVSPMPSEDHSNFCKLH